MHTSLLTRVAPAAVIGVIVVMVAAGAGVVLGSLSSGTALMLPLVAVGGIALGTLALVRFEWFVLAVLFVRSALDSTKPSGSGSATTRGLDPAAALAVLFMVVALVHFAASRRVRSLESTEAPGRPLPRIRRSPIRRPLVAFMIAGLISVIGSAKPSISLYEVLRVTAVVAMLLVLERLLTDEGRIRRVLVAAFASAVIPILYAGIQAARHGGVSIGGFSRIQGTFDHPNPFATYLTFVIIMGVALYKHLPSRTRFPMMLLVAGCSACLLLTYTRSAWIATIAGLLIVGLFQSPRLVGTLLVLILLVAIAVPSVSHRFSDLQGSTRVSGASANSLVWRFSYWKQVASLADQTPVTGIGLKMIEERTDSAKNAHNDFLRVYVETGLLGLSAYVALLVGLARTARRALKTARPGLHRGIAVGFSACLAAFILLSVVSNVISQVVLLWYFVVFAAAAFAVTRIDSAMGGDHRLIGPADPALAPPEKSLV
ncbi:MAG: O-antigen ligase family protein [Pseudonocardiaceae bacterium]